MSILIIPLPLLSTFHVNVQVSYRSIPCWRLQCSRAPMALQLQRPDQQLQAVHISSIRWKSVDQSPLICASGIIWFHLVSSGIIWYRLVSSGIIWYHLVSSGIVWYHLVSSGTIWYRLVPSLFDLVSDCPVPREMQRDKQLKRRQGLKDLRLRTMPEESRTNPHVVL